MITTKALAFALAVSLSAIASTAVAGLHDGIRPGPSPAPWVWRVGPERPAYALTGRLTPVDRKWTRTVEHLGTKVHVDAYRR